MTKLIYPYSQIHSPDLRLTSKEVLVDVDRREVNLAPLLSENVSVSELSATVTIPERDLENSRNLSLAIVTSCARTNLRQATLLSQSKTNTIDWTGLVEIDSRNLRGPVKIKCVISESAGEGHQRIVATSETWTVFVDDIRDGFPASGLDIQWVKFSETPELANFRNATFYVSFDNGVPVVYLNDDVEELRNALPTQGSPPNPWWRSVYEITRSSIAGSVWQLLLQASLAAITPNDEEDESYALPEHEWQRQVLRKLLPALGESEEQAMRKALSAKENADEMQDIVSMAPLVIGHKEVESSKAFRNAGSIVNKLSSPEEIQ